MRGEWSFEKFQRLALKHLRERPAIDAEVSDFENLISSNPLPQSIAGHCETCFGYTVACESCVLATLDDEIPFLRRIHLAWRYSAFRWTAYFYRAEQLAVEFPKKARNRSLPIRKFNAMTASEVLRTAAIAAVLGEDDAHDRLGDRCLQMLEQDEPFGDPETWTLGPVAPFLLWLFCKWRGHLDRFAASQTGSLGPFQCVVDNWDSPSGLEEAMLSLGDLHLRKIREILRPDDDFIFGIANHLGYFIPFEVLYIQRICRDLGMPVPAPRHALLDCPLAQIPCPCPRSGYDAQVARAYSLCKEAMPGFEIPWEEEYLSDESNTDWITEIDWSNWGKTRR